MAKARADVLQGTLTLLVLQTLAHERLPQWVSVANQAGLTTGLRAMDGAPLALAVEAGQVQWMGLPGTEPARLQRKL